jgi:hypothetical protein
VRAAIVSRWRCARPASKSAADTAVLMFNIMHPPRRLPSGHALLRADFRGNLRRYGFAVIRVGLIESEAVAVTNRNKEIRCFINC